LLLRGKAADTLRDSLGREKGKRKKRGNLNNGKGGITKKKGERYLFGGLPSFKVGILGSE